MGVMLAVGMGSASEKDKVLRVYGSRREAAEGRGMVGVSGGSGMGGTFGVTRGEVDKS